MDISINTSQMQLNVKELITELERQYPGVKIDVSQIDNRTRTPKDENGAELSPVQVPGELILKDLPDNETVSSVTAFISGITFSKTDEQFRVDSEKSEAERLLDLVETHGLQRLKDMLK